MTRARDAAGADERPLAPAAPSAGLACPETAPLLRLRRRAEFLAAARAESLAMPGFILQMRPRRADEPAPAGTIRVGFTCSKKVGNAVARNRAKRRLREIAPLDLPADGRPGTDYVLIGRAGRTAERDFDRLQADLATALRKLHKDPGA